MQVIRQVFSSATMTKNKRINNEEQAADSIKSARDAWHGLHLIPGKESGMRVSVPADESLRELLDAFNQPFESQGQSSDDELPPAA